MVKQDVIEFWSVNASSFKSILLCYQLTMCIVMLLQCLLPGPKTDPKRSSAPLLGNAVAVSLSILALRIFLPVVYCNAFTSFTSRPRRLTPKGQALPCLEMQRQCHCQSQLLEFSCQRLRKLTVISSYHILFTLGNWNFEIVWKIRLSPLKTPNQK